MKIYETTFIINPQTDDAALDANVSAVAKLITDSGGKVLHTDRMGTRRLAYEIQGLVQGYYTTITFEASKEVLPTLDRHYKMEEPYVRSLTVLYDGEPEKIGERAPSPFRDSERFGHRRFEGSDSGPRRRGPYGGDRERPPMRRPDERTHAPANRAGDNVAPTATDKAVGTGVATKPAVDQGVAEQPTPAEQPSPAEHLAVQPPNPTDQSEQETPVSADQKAERATEANEDEEL